MRKAPVSSRSFPSCYGPFPRVEPLTLSCMRKGVLQGHNLCYLNHDLKCYRLLKYCLKIMYFWKVIAVWLWRIGQSQKKKIPWIVRRHDEPPRKYHLFSNRCRKVTRRVINIFAAYKLFRIFWFFFWYNANKNRTCVAIVTRRWSVTEMTRNSVNFYVNLNETLF